MRNFASLVTGLALATFFTSGTTVFANPPGIPAGCFLAYKWNIIGYPAGQEYTGNCGNGHRIFVNRDAHHAHILIQDDNDGFHVEDCNATADKQAVLHTDLLGEFTVYARILGKPDGDIEICADVVEDHEDHLCELGTYKLTREGGQSRFNMAPDAIFDASEEDLIWSVDTNLDYRNSDWRVYYCPNQ